MKYDNVLRYLLIILLMFAPMRSALAMPISHCDMDAMVTTSASPIVQKSVQKSNSVVLVASAASDDVSHAHSHHKQQHSEHEQQESQQLASQQQPTHCCCDASARTCTGNCDIGFNLSLIMQLSPYTPVFVHTEKIFLSSTSLLLRVLSPPSRPPLALS